MSRAQGVNFIFFLKCFLCKRLLSCLPFVSESVQLTEGREVTETVTNGQQDKVLTEDENMSVKVTNNGIEIKENGEITYDVHPTISTSSDTAPPAEEMVAQVAEQQPTDVAENTNGFLNTASVTIVEPDLELTAEEQVEKLRTEKTFRKQEEEWARRREKVSLIYFIVGMTELKLAEANRANPKMASWI